MAVNLDTPREEIALLRYRDHIVERLMAAIESDAEAGATPLLLFIKRFRPVDSTSEVRGNTASPISSSRSWR